MLSKYFMLLLAAVAHTLGGESIAISPLIATDMDANRLRFRPIMYGYDDCSHASAVARSYNGCGVPLPAFSCKDLNSGGQKCLDRCMTEVRCDFFSIVFDKDSSTCNCSLRTTESLIGSSRVSGPSDTNDNKEWFESSGMNIYMCNSNNLFDKRLQKITNCDGDLGCAYHTKKGFTVAKVQHDWSLVDTCSVRINKVLLKKAEKERSGESLGLPDPKDILENTKNTGVIDVEELPEGFNVENNLSAIYKPQSSVINSDNHGLDHMGQMVIPIDLGTSGGPGLFGYEGEHEAIYAKKSVKKTKFPSISAKKITKDNEHNVTAHSEYKNVTGDIHDVITANFTDVITMAAHSNGTGTGTFYNTGTDNGCPADCPCKCKKKGTCDCEIEVDIQVEAVIDVNMPDCSDKDKEDCGGGCNGKKFKSD